MRPETDPSLRSASAPAAALLERLPILHPPSSTARAAVTIVLRDGLDHVEVLLIERATNPEDPASGEVALPGGRVDERDGSLMATALRELREEVGLGPADLAGPVRFVGTALAQRFGLHVGVFAAALAESAASPSVASPREVAHVFWLPQATLSDSRLVSQETAQGSKRVWATVHDGHVVWGFTRRVLRGFFGLPEEDAGDGPALSDKDGRLS